MMTVMMMMLVMMMMVIDHDADAHDADDQATYAAADDDKGARQAQQEYVGFYRDIWHFRGFLNFVNICLLRRWKRLDGVVQFAAYKLSFAHNCRYRSILAEECSAPCPS